MSNIPESSEIISHNRTNSVIVRLTEKQYFKSVSVIIILTLLQHPFLKKQKSVVKLYYLRKHSSFFFRIVLRINLQYNVENNPVSLLDQVLPYTSKTSNNPSRNLELSVHEKKSVAVKKL